MIFIKIDPQACTVTTVEGDAGNESFCNLIGCQFLDVCARQDNYDALLIDDDGLSLDPQPPAFSFNGFGPIHGIAIVAGCDEDGKTTEPVYTVEQVLRRIKWLGNICTKPAIFVTSW
ncbi:hypothetical protein [Spirosoma luteum]|uniref:hypothetical protein n=1 Tax=Spirosoma luteum TaxID=431553 RepID=UPI000365E1F7|nr:hypothetical protein [Spirosoma luteum]